MGFEPTVGCPTLDFESSALNRTQPPFRVAEENAEPRLRWKLRRSKRPNVEHPIRLRKLLRRGRNRMQLSSRFGVQRWALIERCVQPVVWVAPTRFVIGVSAHEAKKCYN